MDLKDRKEELSYYTDMVKSVLQEIKEIGIDESTVIKLRDSTIKEIKEAEL